jgi:hypothetical protein
MEVEVMINVTLTACLLLSHSLCVLNCQASFRQEQQIQRTAKSQESKNEWRPAIYRGLTVGTSTSADMFRVLGTPQWAGPPGDQTEDEPNPEVWYEYGTGGEFPGKLTVVVDKGSSTIVGIDLYPENISKQEALKHFGKDYITTRYDFDECLSNGESAPVYESPDGSILNIEYRERGIALAIGYKDRVTHISYVSKPIGATSSKCKHPGKAP